MVARDVTVCEVGLRDGLQSVDTFFPTESKQAWIAAESAAGVPEIQVCSFVPASVIAQFVDAADVVAHALEQPGLLVSVLVPNLRGAQKAFEAGAHKVYHVVSVSESHNQRNVRRSVAESMADFQRIAELRTSKDEWKTITLNGTLSTAFGCTIEGSIELDDVMRLAEQYVEHGVDELALADTVGYANPAQVRDTFTQVRSHLGDVPLAAHFHDTRGLGLANVLAALDAGVQLFDASLAGLGGCPFAPGATGNIVMEDLVFMLEAMGLRTGVDLDRLLAIRNIVAECLPDEPLHGALAKAALPKGFAAPSNHAKPRGAVRNQGS